jgi:hypothetical protein
MRLKRIMIFTAEYAEIAEIEKIKIFNSPNSAISAVQLKSGGTNKDDAPAAKN